jgi:hypothetical protein
MLLFTPTEHLSRTGRGKVPRESMQRPRTRRRLSIDGHHRKTPTSWKATGVSALRLRSVPTSRWLAGAGVVAAVQAGHIHIAGYGRKKVGPSAMIWPLQSSRMASARHPAMTPFTSFLGHASGDYRPVFRGNSFLVRCPAMHAPKPERIHAGIVGRESAFRERCWHGRWVADGLRAVVSRC